MYLPFPDLRCHTSESVRVFLVLTCVVCRVDGTACPANHTHATKPGNTGTGSLVLTREEPARTRLSSFVVLGVASLPTRVHLRLPAAAQRGGQRGRQNMAYFSYSYVLVALSSSWCTLYQVRHRPERRHRLAGETVEIRERHEGHDRTVSRVWCVKHILLDRV